VQTGVLRGPVDIRSELVMPTDTINMKTFAAADGLTLAYYVDDFTDPWRTPDS
jgi:hypothetical protein